jgi:hypothetical protein
VIDQGSLAVHQFFGAGDGCAHGVGDGLVTKANAENWLAGG